MKKILKYIWELPQNLLGLIIKKACKCEEWRVYNDTGVTIYKWNKPGAMSLGNFIFVESGTLELGSLWYKNNLIRHEYGHCLQSRKLGWLYLLIIGAPSFIWAQCFQKYREKKNKSYYDFYTERWANELGKPDERWINR